MRASLLEQIMRFLRRQYASAALETNRYAPAIVLLVWAGLLLCTAVGELLPGDSTPIMALSESNINDKFLHFSAYAAVAFVPVFGLRLGVALVCIIATELVGIALDIAQIFVRERSYDPYDIAANTVGIIVGILVAVVIRSRVVRSQPIRSDD